MLDNIFMRLPVASEFEFAAHTIGLRKYHYHVGSVGTAFKFDKLTQCSINEFAI